MPVGYRLVKKTEKIVNKETGKEQRKSPISKQQHYRDLLKNAVENNVKFKYVLNDAWFASAENMRFIKKELKKEVLAYEQEIFPNAKEYLEKRYIQWTKKN